MARALLFLYAESPVHAGADTSLGALDLPIQREAGTALPVVWGQSLKGALRSHARGRWGPDDPKITRLFGDPPPTGPNPAPAKPGRLSVGDAQLVAFPVATLHDTFAWLTSPLVLGRLRRRAGLVDPDGPRAAALAGQQVPAATDSTVLSATDRWAAVDAVFGPYVAVCQPDEATAGWARVLSEAVLPAGAEFDFFRTKLRRDLVVVGDGLLTAVTKECGEVTPRVQLKTSVKTVEHGPFYVEYLPTETILVAVVEAVDVGDLTELGAVVTDQVMHLGGDETIGKGLIWCRLVGDGGGGGTAQS